MVLEDLPTVSICKHCSVILTSQMSMLLHYGASGPVIHCFRPRVGLLCPGIVMKPHVAYVS